MCTKTEDGSFQFWVWAPRVRSVELVLRDSTMAMQQVGSGVWQVTTAAAMGDRYGYRLDGSSPVPDPRSRWQPDGIHGLSAVFDPEAFAWSDTGFTPVPWPNAVIYELHVGTFTREGTFDTAIAKLDTIVELGATHVELLPVADFPGMRGWGYDGVHLFTTHRAYGGPAALQRFVDAAHTRGVGVILDVVYNHLGPDGSVLDRFGPYHSGQTPWGLDLHFCGDPAVRRFVIDNALMWLREFHIDGLRLDAVQFIIDPSPCHILEELAAEVVQLTEEKGYKPILIAETPMNDPLLLRTPEHGGYGLDAQWNDDLHHALQCKLTGEACGYYADFTDPDALLHLMGQPFWFDGTRESVFRHSAYGGSPDRLSGSHLIAYDQSHDQVGNRPDGQRLHALVGLAKTKVAAALILTSPYVPMLFQGEEWASDTPFYFFTDHGVPGLGDAVDRGRKREFDEFGWSHGHVAPHPQDLSTFTACILDWEAAERGEHREMREWYRQLLALRRERLGARDFREDRVRQHGEAWWFVRAGLHVLTNPTETTIDLSLPDAGRLLLASDDGVRWSSGDLQLPAWSVAILDASDSTTP